MLVFRCKYFSVLMFIKADMHKIGYVYSPYVTDYVSTEALFS